MAEAALQQDVPENPYLGMEPEHLANELYHENQVVKELNAKVKAAEKERNLIQDALLEYKDRHPACKKIGTDLCTVTFSEEEVFNVNDWDAMYAYIAEHNAFYLLQRRLNNAPMRELRTLGTELPCVTPFTQRKVGVRKA